MRMCILRACQYTKECNLGRHGDILKRTVGGFFIIQGRADDTMNLGSIKASSFEIERVCNRVDDGILETAAVSSPPPDGGPERLAIFIVLKEGINSTPEELRMKLSRAIQTNLNPLFKVSFVKTEDCSGVSSNSVEQAAEKSFKGSVQEGAQLAE